MLVNDRLKRYWARQQTQLKDLNWTSRVRNNCNNSEKTTSCDVFFNSNARWVIICAYGKCVYRVENYSPVGNLPRKAIQKAVEVIAHLLRVITQSLWTFNALPPASLSGTGKSFMIALSALKHDFTRHNRFKKWLEQRKLRLVNSIYSTVMPMSQSKYFLCEDRELKQRAHKLLTELRT